MESATVAGDEALATSFLLRGAPFVPSAARVTWRQPMRAHAMLARRDMGLTYTTVRITPLAGSRKHLEESFLVDTGAIDCLVSAAKLRKVGIKPEGKDVYELADGTTVELPYGFARVRFMGSETVSKVTFGPGDAESILGVAALESTGIGVDPVTKALNRMAAKHLKLGRQPPLPPRRHGSAR